jgi:hypothetical protein
MVTKVEKDKMMSDLICTMVTIYSRLPLKPYSFGLPEVQVIY